MQSTTPWQGEKPCISIGSDPIDKALLGGLPLGSLSLIEGPSGTGKSVISQHLAFGALLAEFGVAYYVHGMDEQGLIEKMNTLYLDVKPFIGEGQLLISPITDFYDGKTDPAGALKKIRQHMQSQAWDINLIVVDSLATLINHAGAAESFDFFLACKEICSWDKSILISLHTSALDPDLLVRLNNLFDTHINLTVEAFSQGIQMKQMHVMNIVKVKNVDLKSKTSIYFEVDTELGRSMNMSLKVLPFFRIKT